MSDPDENRGLRIGCGNAGTKSFFYHKLEACTFTHEADLREKSLEASSYHIAVLEEIYRMRTSINKGTSNNLSYLSLYQDFLLC